MEAKDLMKLFSDEVKDENIRYIISSFLTNIDIKAVDKEFVLDYLYEKCNTVNTVKLYKYWIGIMFSIFVQHGIIKENPVSQISDQDMSELCKRIIDKHVYVSKETIIHIVNEYQERSPVRALCVYALFEGIKNDELAYIEKGEIDGNLVHIKGRTDPFVMDEKLRTLMYAIKDTEYAVMSRNGTEYLKPFVNSKYVIRPLEKKGAVNDQVKILRSKTNYIRREFGLSTRQIYESGFLYYFKQQNVSPERLKWLLQKYNMKMSDAMLIIDREM